MTATKLFNETKAMAFAEEMVQVVNHGAIALMVSIGHRTGLFDAMSQLPAVTLQTLVKATGLQERYVKEWLGAMVTGRIVDYSPETQTYRLPAEHAAFLTRAAKSNNIGAFTQYIAVLGTVEDQIVECFEQGGGVPYSQYARFHQVMAEDSGQNVVAMLEEAILPLVPGLIDRLRQGIRVLDVGCGSGRAMNRLARLFPNSQVKGYDISEQAIATARAEAASQGLTNVQFVVQDAAQIQDIQEYDLITTFDAVHDQARPDLVLEAIARALRPDGVYLMQDIRASSYVERNLDNPLAPFTYTISCMHCMTVSLAAGGMGLGAAWGEEKALEMLADAGFVDTVVTQLDHDVANNYYISRVGVVAQ
jgi:2-polyprenyl-3-methyl-5-hydroxy-6-metoxy-1,4-benzoquinol methylase